VKELITPTSEGGFGADLFDTDLEGNMPIHVAIDFNRKDVFKVMLDQLINAGGICAASTEEQNPPFEVIDKLTSELSLASRCVIK
jgi:ankyrin repeat protein